MKSAEEILKEKYLHPLSKTQKQWIYEAMHEYSAQDRWVKVSDVEPQIGVPYNIVYSGVVQWVAFKFDGENWVDMHDIAPALPKNDVSHYQPLPTAPKD